MVENVDQIKSELTTNIDASVKDIIYVEKIIFGILLFLEIKVDWRKITTFFK